MAPDEAAGSFDGTLLVPILFPPMSRFSVALGRLNLACDAGDLCMCAHEDKKPPKIAHVLFQQPWPVDMTLCLRAQLELLGYTY